jgi:hypothetical protein
MATVDTLRAYFKSPYADELAPFVGGPVGAVLRLAAIGLDLSRVELLPPTAFPYGHRHPNAQDVIVIPVDDLLALEVTDSPMTRDGQHGYEPIARLSTGECVRRPYDDPSGRRYVKVSALASELERWRAGRPPQRLSSLFNTLARLERIPARERIRFAGGSHGPKSE